MITREVSREIAAPAEALWAMVSDVTRMGEWSPETTGAEWVDGAAGPAVGAKFKGSNQRRVPWTTTCEVVAAEPGREFAFAVGGGENRNIWRYRFDSLDGERTRVTESFEFPKGISGFNRFLSRVLSGVKGDRVDDLERGMATTLENLERVATSG